MAISKERKRVFGKVLVIDFREAKHSAKLGITAPRSFGKAVQRNQFKRRVREAFRTHQHTMPPVEMVVFPKRGVSTPSFESINEDLLTFYAHFTSKYGQVRGWRSNFPLEEGRPYSKDKGN